MNAVFAEVEPEVGVRGPGSPTRLSTLASVRRHVGTAGRFRPECASCAVRTMCLPCDLSPTETRLLDFVVVSRRTVHRGQTLYLAGDPCAAIYPIRAGFFKTSVVSLNGDEQVTGLRMSGDVLGLDGISTRQHSCDAVALDHGEVCIIPVPNLLRQSLHEEALQRTFFNLLGREIAREQELLLLLGGMWGIQRVAMFLLDVSQRMQAHGYSPSEFELRLTRREIGSYLGMELETVSRIVSRLEREALIMADRGHIRIVDREGLTGISSDHSERSFAARNASAAAATSSATSELRFPALERRPRATKVGRARTRNAVADLRV